MPQPGLIDQLLTRLNSGIASAPELEQALGVSQSSMSRILRRLVSDARVLRIGSTRGARYGLRRGISGIGSSWPLRRIDRAGALHNFGQLHALAAGEYYFEPSQQARTEDFAWGGVSPGLPYFLHVGSGGTPFRVATGSSTFLSGWLTGTMSTTCDP